MTAIPPHSLERRRGRDRAALDPGLELELPEHALRVIDADPLILDRDKPRRVVARGSGEHDVASEVDEDAIGARAHDLAGDDVGGKALADCARVDADTRRQCHGAELLVDDDAGHSGRRLDHERSARRSNGPTGDDRREVGVIPGSLDRGQDRGVEEPAGHLPGRLHRGDEADEISRAAHRA